MRRHLVRHEETRTAVTVCALSDPELCWGGLCDCLSYLLEEVTSIAPCLLCLFTTVALSLPKSFNDLLGALLQRVKGSDIVVVASDINARVGGLSSSFIRALWAYFRGRIYGELAPKLPNSSGVRINRSALTSFRCLAVILPEGSTRDGILPSWPNLDRGSREAEVRFEPRTLRCRAQNSTNKPNHSVVIPFRFSTITPPEGAKEDETLRSYRHLDNNCHCAGTGFRPSGH
ncbi:hypothetical protein T265_04012 [Opisthorchis viverrini]|uniref:Uncharacterized protein n=1 Tax=Opisthorchis viverrini TaxID=6198 RepID=A0A074ZQG3_OPIVI|nr:hypothetical protein T265_04012 [Opisthorchis viverrini]KER29351.1 hypothetical protein T265_04012 [Opisthorchis viverrini]